MDRRRRQLRPRAVARAATAGRGLVPRMRVWLAMAFVLAVVSALARKASAAELDPGQLEVKVWTADEHELPRIEREVVRLIQKSPRSALAHHLLAHVLIRMFAKDPGDLYVLKQASDLAQQAVDLDPRNGVGYVAMADILDLMGNADRALRLLDEAEAAGVRPNWRFYFTRARLLSAQASSAKVLGLLQTALAFTDAQPRIVVPYVVAILQAESSGTELIAKLEDWNSRFPSPLFELTKAITWAELGQFKKAHVAYQSILKADHQSKEAKINGAILLYRDLKDGAQAETLLGRVLVEHQEELPSGVKAMVLAHLGAARLQRRQWDRAGEAFLEAVKVDSQNLGVIDFITRSYRDQKAHDKLATLLGRINDQVPGTGLLHALLGETLSEHLQRHDEALRSFSNAIILDPDRSDYYNGMGLAYYRKRSFKQALKLFATATEVDPSDATARYNEACVLSLMGRSEEAIDTLAEALSLDPRLAQNARSDADLARLQSFVKFRELVQEAPAVRDTARVGH